MGGAGLLKDTQRACRRAWEWGHGPASQEMSAWLSPFFFFFPSARPSHFLFSCSKTRAAAIAKVGGLERGVSVWRAGRGLVVTGGLALCLAVWVQSLARWFSGAIAQRGLFLAFPCVGLVGRREVG